LDVGDTPGALRIGPTLLAAGRPGAPQHGRTMVAKDLLDVAGIATGAGNPDWLADARPAERTAPALLRLLDAGFDLIGKAHTDELAFSLSGTNVHYGTPRNPAAPDRIPGGSSCGSASAVACGIADLGVGTDTGGSIRVPASYCGLYGWRPTHGRVPIDGCVPLAPTFDTIGLLTRDGSTLADAASALLGGPRSARAPGRLVLAADLLAHADPAVMRAIRATTTELAGVLGVAVDEVDVARGQEERWFAAFRARQLVEAWTAHGEWITRRTPTFGPGIAARFLAASRADPAAASRADAVRGEVRDLLVRLLDGDGALVLPAAATVAPRADLVETAKADLRTRTMTLTCVAGLAGAPAVVVPHRGGRSLPAGTCLVGRPGDDEGLLEAAAALDAARGADERRRSTR
jgi:amidase